MLVNAQLHFKVPSMPNIGENSIIFIIIIMMIIIIAIFFSPLIRKSSYHCLS